MEYRSVLNGLEFTVPDSGSSIVIEVGNKYLATADVSQFLKPVAKSQDDDESETGAPSLAKRSKKTNSATVELE